MTSKFSYRRITNMSKRDYNSQAELLVKVIDIAVVCFTKLPHEGWKENEIKQFINIYLDYRRKIENPDPRFKNLTSLNYIKNDILTYFQEGSGRTVNAFWEEINKQQLGIKRINKFERILKRGKIRNNIEYDTIIDLYNSYIENKILSNEEIDKINDLLSAFEKTASA